MKEDSYTDVTLKLDNGKQFFCHRCVLAGSSAYFDCMLSRGMRQSKVQIVYLVGVSSSMMAQILQFIDTSRCTFKYADFFDMLTLSNMFQLEELEMALTENILKPGLTSN
jgi:hypothetical protein